MFLCLIQLINQFYTLIRNILSHQITLKLINVLTRTIQKLLSCNQITLVKYPIVKHITIKLLIRLLKHLRTTYLILYDILNNQLIVSSDKQVYQFHHMQTMLSAHQQVPLRLPQCLSIQNILQILLLHTAFAIVQHHPYTRELIGTIPHRHVSHRHRFVSCFERFDFGFRRIRAHHVVFEVDLKRQVAYGRVQYPEHHVVNIH